jgi:radical SAM enzyme (TIGR01210 family)
MNDLWNLLSELNARRMKYKNKSNKKGNPSKYISAWLEDDLLPVQIDVDGKSKKSKNSKNSKKSERNMKNNKIKALVVVLRTNGCSWSKHNPNGTSKIADYKSHSIGNCTMCGYNNDCLPETQRIDAGDLVQQFRAAVDRFGEKSFDVVKIFTSGSFLDDSEVHPEAREKILEMLNENGVNSFIFETRPEFVNPEKLRILKNSYNGTIQVAFGLESCNDNVLKYSINKGFSFVDFQSSAQMVRESGFSIKTYLLLKPPFLNEHDAITDVLNSIKILHSSNLTDCISINPVNVQKYTLVEYLFERGDYRPPWLWSLLYVLQKGSKILKDRNIRLMSQPTAGGLSRGVHNCYKCDPSVLSGVNTFSFENDTKFFSGLNCECKKHWQDVLNLEMLARSDRY